MDLGLWWDDVDPEHDYGYCSEEDQEEQQQQQQQQQDVDNMEVAYVDQLDIQDVVEVEEVQQTDSANLLKIQDDFLKEFEDPDQKWVMHEGLFRFMYFMFEDGNEELLRRNAQFVLGVHNILHTISIHVLQAVISTLLEEHFYIGHILKIKYNLSISYENFFVLRHRLYFYDPNQIIRVIQFKSPNEVGRLTDCWFFLRAMINNMIVEYYRKMKRLLPPGNCLYFWPHVRFSKTGGRPNERPENIDLGIW